MPDQLFCSCSSHTDVINQPVFCSPEHISVSPAQASVQLIFYPLENPDYTGGTQLAVQLRGKTVYKKIMNTCTHHSLGIHHLDLTSVPLVGESRRLPGISTDFFGYKHL